MGSELGVQREQGQQPHDGRLAKEVTSLAQGIGQVAPARCVGLSPASVGVGTPQPWGLWKWGLSLRGWAGAHGGGSAGALWFALCPLCPPPEPFSHPRRLEGPAGCCSVQPPQDSLPFAVLSSSLGAATAGCWQLAGEKGGIAPATLSGGGSGSAAPLLP